MRPALSCRALAAPWAAAAPPAVARLGARWLLTAAQLTCQAHHESYAPMRGLRGAGCGDSRVRWLLLRPPQALHALLLLFTAFPSLTCNERDHAAALIEPQRGRRS